MTAQKITIGDLLKAEADRLSRISLPAPEGTKAGQPVLHELRSQYLIALTDEEHGKVLVQPHNCTIYLKNVDAESLKNAVATPNSGGGEPVMSDLTVDDLKSQGDVFGIKYIGELET